MPDPAIKESRERIRSAVKNSDLAYPRQSVVVNLAPADLKKEGPSYDLPIAISILAIRGYIDKDHYQIFNDSLFIGELSLDGSLRGVNGVLSIALFAKENGFKKIFLPLINSQEASLVFGIEVYPVENLAQLVKHLRGKEEIVPLKSKKPSFKYLEDDNYDMAFIKGQEHAKKATGTALASCPGKSFTSS